MGKHVDAMGGPMDIDQMPLSGFGMWDSEMLTVVGVAPATIALYSGVHNRFVCLSGQTAHARCGPMRMDELPPDCECVRFTVVDAGNDKFALYSGYSHRFLRMGNCGVVDANTESQDVNSHPTDWETFAFRKLTEAEITEVRAHYWPAQNSSNGFMPLNHGSVIALHSPAQNRFIRIMNMQVEAHGGPMNFDALPVSGSDRWSSELFIVVYAGNGEIALYNKWHRRFICMDNEEVMSSCIPLGINDLSPDSQAERFTIVHAGDGLIALYSRSAMRFVRMDSNGIVDSKGGTRAMHALPKGWGFERFAVRELTPAEIIGA